MKRIASRYLIIGATGDGAQEPIESGLTRSDALQMVAKWKTDGAPAKAKGFKRFALAEIVLQGKSYECRVSSTRPAKTTQRDS